MLSLFACPTHERIAAKRDADSKDGATVQLFELPKYPIDFFKVTRVVSAWGPIEFATAASEVRHSHVPTALLRFDGKCLRVMAVRRTFKAMKQNEQGCVFR